MPRLLIGPALAVAFVVVASLAAPLGRPATAETATSRAMVLPVDRAQLVVETTKGPRWFSIEIADDGEERSRGLMFRDKMPADRGMLFVFQETRRAGFWMQNTPLPLDLIFIAEDGSVRAIRRGAPFSTDLISPDAPVRFVLELNAGIAQKTGIAVGDRVRHPAIDAVASGAD